MISVSRAGWNARPPDSTTPLNKSKVNLFIVHYSGASREQTVRSIQDFCMDSKGHVDIDYNRIVKGEFDYMGRGWNVGGHTANTNSTSYGVCVIGQDGDATNADLTTVRQIYDQVCAELGRQLVMTDHRNVLGAHYTSCPGDEIDAWVDAGMPYPGGDMAASSQAEHNDAYAQQNGIMGLEEPVVHIPAEGPWGAAEFPNPLGISIKALVTGGDAVIPAFGNIAARTWVNGTTARLMRVEAKLDQLLALPPGSVNPEALRAIVVEELNNTRLSNE